jgi:CrcB protein
MNGFLLAALGGAVGAAGRYGVGLLAVRAFGADLPFATLIVNVAGGLAMGLLTGLAVAQDRSLQVLLGVGVLGGFTTFSAFSMEMVRMVEAGQAPQAGLYAVASVLASAGACLLGLMVGRALS